MQEVDLLRGAMKTFAATLEEEEITLVEGEAPRSRGERTTVSPPLHISEPPPVQIAHAVATGDSIRMYLAEIGRVPLLPTLTR